MEGHLTQVSYVLNPHRRLNKNRETGRIESYGEARLRPVRLSRPSK